MKTPLSDYNLDELRACTTFGADGTPFLDGAAIGPRCSNGLHRIQGVFAVDVANAVKYDDPLAWTVLLEHGFIRE